MESSRAYIIDAAVVRFGSWLFHLLFIQRMFFIQRRFWSLLSGGNRVLLAASITEIDRDIRKQKLRLEHPEWCELEIRHQIIRESFRMADRSNEPVPQWLEKQMAERLEQERASR